MNRSVFTWRIYWCIGVLVLGYVRAWFGDPEHPSAADRSLLFTAVWTCTLLAYVCIMYLHPHKRPGIDYFVLVGCLFVIAFEVLWPIAALHNSHAARVSGPLAVGRLYSLWVEKRWFQAQSTADTS
jgi:hypothetical protein